MIRIFLFLFFPIAAFGLSLDECLEIAKDENPLARAANENAKAACADVGIAKAPYYPDLNIVASTHRYRQFFPLPNTLSGQPLPGIVIEPVIGPTMDYFLQAQTRWLLYDFGRRSSRLEAIRSKAHQASWQIEQTEQQITRDVSIAFYELLSAIELLEVAKKNLELTDNHLNVAKKRFDAGSAPKEDVLRMKVQVANAKQALIREQASLRILRGKLNVAMGLPPPYPLDITQEKKEIPLPTEQDLEKAMHLAEEKRPEVIAANFELTALQHQIEKEKGGYGPKVYFDAAYGRHDQNYFPQVNQWTYGVQLEMPLFSGFDTEYSVTRARHQFLEAAAKLEELLLNVQQEVWESFAKLLETHEQIETSNTEVIDAKESLRLAEERYRVGASTATELLDAETAYFRAEATHVKAFWDYRRAFVEYQWTFGNL